TMTTESAYRIAEGDKISSAFPNEINNNTTVKHLKESIVQEKPNTFEDIDPNDLKLWKIDLDSLDVDYIPQFDISDGDTLIEAGKLSGIFPDGILENNIHILIRKPDVQGIY